MSTKCIAAFSITYLSPAHPPDDLDVIFVRSCIPKSKWKSYGLEMVFTRTHEYD